MDDDSFDRLVREGGICESTAREIVAYHKDGGLNDEERLDLYRRATLQALDAVSAFVEEAGNIRHRSTDPDDFCAISMKIKACRDMYTRLVHSISP